jgi:hypothetical protein
VTTNENTTGIRFFLLDRMKDIRKRHDMCPDWHREETIGNLVKCSAGLFIWASTDMSFILEGYDAQEQLDILMRTASYKEAATTLDSLYTKVLDASGKWNGETFAADFRSVIGIVLAGRIPLTDRTIDELLGLTGRRDLY